MSTLWGAERGHQLPHWKKEVVIIVYGMPAFLSFSHWISIRYFHIYPNTGDNGWIKNQLKRKLTPKPRSWCHLGVLVFLGLFIQPLAFRASSWSFLTKAVMLGKLACTSVPLLFCLTFSVSCWMFSKELAALSNLLTRTVFVLLNFFTTLRLRWHTL